jgi:hypothetical protein
MGIADISYNERTGSTEIVHTYTAHDLATLLTNLYGRQFDLGRADSEAPLRRYVEKQFTIADKDGKRLPLQWVGVKVDADSVVIYQELPRKTDAGQSHSQRLADRLPAVAKEHQTCKPMAPPNLFDQSNIDQIAP